MTVLFVQGIPDDSRATLGLDERGKIYYNVTGSCAVHGNISLPEVSSHSITLFGNRTRQARIRLPRKSSLIFNQISDADTHAGALKRCVKLVENFDCPVINPPQRILQTARNRVSELLRDIPGVVVPKTIRFQPRAPRAVFEAAASHGLQPPFIVRVAGDHGGKRMVRVSNEDDPGALHALPFDGRDFYLIEFLDYESGDGLYRKTRIVVVDGTPLIRHHLIHSDWMVHASAVEFMLDNPSLKVEEAELLANFDATLRPRIEARVTEIRKRLGLDYFGIDCHVNEQDNMLIFEANASMNILANRRAEYGECLETIKTHIRRMILDQTGRET